MNLNKKTHERWMSEALHLAQYAAIHGDVPIGAIVVLNDCIIGRGWNQTISACDPTAHAEIVALRDAAKHIQNHRLVDADLYVTTEPCTMCAGALVHARIKQLIFAACEPKSGAIISTNQLLDHPALNHKVLVIENILAEKSRQLLQQFFQKRRKT